MALRISAAAFLLFLSLQARATPPQNPESSQRVIETLIEKGNLSQAEATLKQALASSPNSPSLTYSLGQVYLRESKFAAAEQAFEEADKLSPNNPQVLFAFCRAEFQLKKAPAALRLAERVSALAGNDPRPHFALGRLLLENGLSRAALGQLKKARAIAPQNPAITTEIILTYQALGQTVPGEALLKALLKSASYDDLMQAGSRFGERGALSLAVRAFSQALNLRPTSYDARFDLAFAEYQRHELRQALESLNRMPPGAANGHADYHNLRAKLEESEKQDLEAGEEFLKAVRLDPGSEAFCSDAGLFFFRLENYWKALEAYETCARKQPESATLETGLGLTYFRLGKYQEAKDTFENVLLLRPEADAAREALAFLDYVDGHLAEAQDVIRQRIDQDAGDFYLYYLDALVAIRRVGDGGRAEALRGLAQAIERNPEFAPAYFERGRIEARRGQDKLALRDFERSTELDPTYAQPYYLVAQIDYKLGNKSGAEKARRRFAALNRETEEKAQERQVEDQLLQAMH